MKQLMSLFLGAVVSIATAQEVVFVYDLSDSFRGKGGYEALSKCISPAYFSSSNSTIAIVGLGNTPELLYHGVARRTLALPSLDAALARSAGVKGTDIEGSIRFALAIFPSTKRYIVFSDMLPDTHTFDTRVLENKRLVLVGVNSQELQTTTGYGFPVLTTQEIRRDPSLVLPPRADSGGALLGFVVALLIVGGSVYYLFSKRGKM